MMFGWSTSIHSHHHTGIIKLHPQATSAIPYIDIYSVRYIECNQKWKFNINERALLTRLKMKNMKIHMHVKYKSLKC